MRSAWVAVLVQVPACAELAYQLHLRLIARDGPALAVTVNYLILVSVMLWGARGQ